MKQLWIIRHAKSSWSDITLADHNRPLNQRGQRDAPRMAQIIKKDYVVPEVMVTSSAKRARRTCKLMRKAWSMNKSHVIRDPMLYHASLSACMQVIHRIDEEYQIAAIFGHNPTFTYLIHELTGEGPDNLPTAGCALIESTAEFWSTFESDNCQLKHFIYPKMFV